MCVDRGLVAAGRRTSQGVGGPQLADVPQGTRGQVQEGLQGHAEGRGYPLHLAQQGDQVVGCHHGGGVIGDPVVRCDCHGTTAQ